MLHHLESFRLLRPDLRTAMVNEQSREIEHPSHPGDHGHDMNGCDPGSEAQGPPQHKYSNEDRHDAKRHNCPDRGLAALCPHRPSPYARTRPIIRSTCSIGVSGAIPCPRLKMNGRSANAASTASTALSSARPPATSASGSRLPCTATPAGMIPRANLRSILQSSPTAFIGTPAT